MKHENLHSLLSIVIAFCDKFLDKKSTKIFNNFQYLSKPQTWTCRSTNWLILTWKLLVNRFGFFWNMEKLISRIFELRLKIGRSSKLVSTINLIFLFLIKLQCNIYFLFLLAMPTGVLPVLEVEGKRLDQSLSICRFVAKQIGLCGSNDFEDFEIDSVVDTINDFRFSKFSYFFINGFLKTVSNSCRTSINSLPQRTSWVWEKFKNAQIGHNSILPRPTWSNRQGKPWTLCIETQNLGWRLLHRDCRVLEIFDWRKFNCKLSLLDTSCQWHFRAEKYQKLDRHSSIYRILNCRVFVNKKIEDKTIHV